METDDQTETIEFLSSPAAYLDGVDHVDTIRTHASIVFLAGDRAYKLKRAVKYSYLDYSSPELRHDACQAELRLNRRTAPSLYLAVRPVCRGFDGRLQLGSGSPVLDWVVVMARFPQEALFSRLAESRLLTPALAALAADRVAAFHAIAERTPDYGGRDGIAEVIMINDENLRRPTVGVGAAEIDRLHKASLESLGRHSPLLEARRNSGKVRRCHGDLHLGNICLLDGLPTLFDCIEFSASIACIDVLYDLAFLLMDLRFRGLGDRAAAVFNRYLDVAGEEDGLPLVPLFMSLRAAVRAHVTAASAAPTGTEQSIDGDERLVQAHAYFDFAIDLLKPRATRLIAIGGLSGTGKSTVAAGLAGDLGTAPGARVLRSDVLRKRLHNLPPETRLPQDAYGEADNRRVYDQLEAKALEALAAGYSVVIDAVSARPQERRGFAELARKAGVPFTGIWLDATPDILHQRLVERGKDASDATPDVLRRQLDYDLGDIEWRRLNTETPIAEIVKTARRILKISETRGS